MFMMPSLKVDRTLDEIKKKLSKLETMKAADLPPVCESVI